MSPCQPLRIISSAIFTDDKSLRVARERSLMHFLVLLQAGERKVSKGQALRNVASVCIKAGKSGHKG
jgi:hypothetical protein